MHRYHPLHRRQRLVHRDAFVEGRDDPGIFRRGPDMAGREEALRVMAVPAQQHVVELGLDFAVAHPALAGVGLHIGVTGAVQRKMADKAQRIGQRSIPVCLAVHHPARPVKKDPPRLLVHGVAQCTHRVGLGSMVIKQQIRPVQAHVEQGPVFPDLILQGCGQLLQNIRAEAAVRIS